MRFWRRYFAGVLVTAAGFHESGDIDKAESVWLGAYDAFFQRGGMVPVGRTVPRWSFRILTAFPYLTANLLRGEFGVVMRRLFSKHAPD